MFLLKHFYRQIIQFGSKPGRLVYDEAPSPDIQEEHTLNESLRGLAVSKDRPTLTLENHQFDDAKIKALNLLITVEASAGKGYEAQVRALKEELARDIHDRFDALHQNYITNIQERIYNVGEGSRANQIRAEERGKAQKIIEDIKNRVHAVEVKERVQYEAGLKGLQEASEGNDKGRQIEAGSAVISNFLRLLHVPEKVRGFARYIAKEMQEQGELGNLLDKGSVKEALDWFKRVKLEDTDLIERAIKRMAKEAPQIKATESEKRTFEGILKKYKAGSTEVSSNDWLPNFGINYLPQATEALALRFSTINVNPAGDPDGQLNYYIDLKHPETIYTHETLPGAVKAIVESEMQSGERGDVTRQLEEMSRMAEQLNRALFSVAELKGGAFNDMVDTLTELQGEDKGKLDQLAMLLKHAENTDRARVLPFDTKTRAHLTTERKRKAAEAKEKNERDHQVDDYVKARTDLVNVKLAASLEFVPKNKTFDTAKIGELDVIEIKKGLEVVARIETKVEAPHLSRLTVFGTKHEVVFAKNYKTTDLKDQLTAHPDVIGVREAVIKDNQAKLNALEAEESIWGLSMGTEKNEVIELIPNLYMESFEAVMNGIQPISPLSVEIPLKSRKEGVIGHLQINWNEAGKAKGFNVVIIDGTIFGQFSTLNEAKNYVKISASEILKKGREALANKAAVDKVRAAIKLPEGFTLEDALKCASYTNPESALDLTVKNANGAEVGTIKINVVTRKITFSADKDTSTCDPKNIDAVFKFFNDKAATLKDKPPAKEVTAPVAPGAAPATPERAPLAPELEAVRSKLVDMLRAQSPDVFTEAALKNPVTQTAIDNILKNLQNNKPRLDLLAARKDFVPSPGEQAMILAEVEKAHGWEKLGEVDSAETNMIWTLQRPGDRKAFEELVGSQALAANLSRQYEIKPGEKANAIIINDGKKNTDVMRLEDLAPFITDLAERENFLKAINPDPQKAAEALSAKEALDQSAQSREQPLETVRSIQAALKNPDVQKMFSEMSFTEAAGAIFQIFQAISEALQSKPPDFRTLNDTLKCLTDGKPRNPADVMTKNAGRFERIIRDNAPDKAENQPDYIKQLLEVHLDPGGKAGDAFFNQAHAATSGITEAQELKDLALFRREAKPVIVNYFKEQFSVDNITKISKVKVDGVSRIKLEGDHGGARFDAEFYNKSGKWSADIFKFETVESKLQRKPAPEKTVEGVTFATLKEAITGVKTAEATPPPEDEIVMPDEEPAPATAAAEGAEAPTVRLLPGELVAVVETILSRGQRAALIREIYTTAGNYRDYQRYVRESRPQKKADLDKKTLRGMALGDPGEVTQLQAALEKNPQFKELTGLKTEDERRAYIASFQSGLRDRVAAIQREYKSAVPGTIPEGTRPWQYVHQKLSDPKESFQEQYALVREQLNNPLKA